jgi:hypothetical protein
VFKESSFSKLKDTSEYLDMACRILTIKYMESEDGIKDHIESEDIDSFFLNKLLAGK